jgi:ER membrane protein complex subunit 1
MTVVELYLKKFENDTQKLLS